MEHLQHLYINGAWVDPVVAHPHDVINPATEEIIATISLGSEADVDKAVIAARNAFETWSVSSREERIALFERILAVYQSRYDEFVETISAEMGAPLSLARDAQAATGLAHFATTLEVLKHYEFETNQGSTRLLREPIGVCGLITPWNWPVNQIACKVAPALATGCTMILKPSEIAPMNACLFAQVLDEAGVPPGVFNLVYGDGATVGEAISGHPGIDMVSFTGSTRAGIAVAKAAAETVKRVSQELGGKSPNIILDDADFELAVGNGVRHCFNNSGQSCNAPTRMLVPAERMDDAIAIAVAAAAKIVVGDPASATTTIGPVVSEMQFDKIQTLIDTAIAEGAELVCGGPGKPEGLETGYYVKPTIFANVSPEMTIAKEEVFGPVLSLMAYQSDEDAIAIANDTPYGLAGYVSGSDADRVLAIARRLRAGAVNLNSAPADFNAPFGGYKQSGNGREWGELGFEEFLEVKAVLGVNH